MLELPIVFSLQIQTLRGCYIHCQHHAHTFRDVTVEEILNAQSITEKLLHLKQLSSTSVQVWVFDFSPTKYYNV